MSSDTDVYCSICFAMPGEMCRTKYVVHGRDEVTPVTCRTHSARLVAGQRDSIRQSFARQLLAVALLALRDRSS
jgi:hypothetical protein